MRVISGTAKGSKLFSPVGENTRPTADRTKEDLFNILSDKVPGSVFLDLFSGSGAIGIEALSRGADSVTFVERDNAVCKLIKKNIEKTRLLNCEIIQADVLPAIKRADKTYDIIFLDPPYNSGLVYDTMELLDSADILRDGGVIAAESGNEEKIYDTGRFELYKVKQYRICSLLFFRRSRIL